MVHPDFRLPNSIFFQLLDPEGSQQSGSDFGILHGLLYPPTTEEEYYENHIRTQSLQLLKVFLTQYQGVLLQIRTLAASDESAEKTQLRLLEGSLDLLRCYAEDLFGEDVGYINAALLNLASVGSSEKVIRVLTQGLTLDQVKTAGRDGYGNAWSTDAPDLPLLGSPLHYAFRHGNISLLTWYHSLGVRPVLSEEGSSVLNPTQDFLNQCLAQFQSDPDQVTLVQVLAYAYLPGLDTGWKMSEGETSMSEDRYCQVQKLMKDWGWIPSIPNLNNCMMAHRITLPEVRRGGIPSYEEFCDLLVGIELTGKMKIALVTAMTRHTHPDGKNHAWEWVKTRSITDWSQGTSIDEIKEGLMEVWVKGVTQTYQNSNGYAGVWLIYQAQTYLDQVEGMSPLFIPACEWDKSRLAAHVLERTHAKILGKESYEQELLQLESRAANSKPLPFQTKPRF